MDIPDLTGLTPATQLHIIQIYLVLKIGGSLYSSIRNGGGLKRILTSFWLGENLPKVVNADYKEALSTPPFPPKNQSTP